MNTADTQITPVAFEFPDLSDTLGLQPIEKSTGKRPLLTRIGDSHDFVLEIDNTTMEYFQTCPRSSFYYTVERKQRPDKPALIFGGAVHAGLEVIYRDGFDAIDAARGATLAHFDKHPIDLGTDYRTPAYAVQALLAYHARYSLMDNLTPISRDWVERPFALNVGSFDIRAQLPYSARQLTNENSDDPLYIAVLHAQFTGKIDIIATNGDHRKYVVDHKTSSMGGETFYQDFILAQQTHGYMWAAQQILGEQLAGFILNPLVIRKPSRTGVPFEFERRVFDYTQESLEEWKSDFLYTFESYVHHLTQGQFPKHTKWCMGKYGRCPYHDVCALPTAQRKYMLHGGQYADVVWSPLVSD